MKRIYKFLITLGVIIAVPVTAAYVCFYDGTRKPDDGVGTLNINTFLPSKMAVAMADTKTTGKIDVSVSDFDLDCVLRTLLEDKAKDATKYIKQAFVDIEDDVYTFSIAAQVPLFKTRLQLATKLTSEKVDGQDVFTFKINSIKLGRISGIDNAIIGLAQRFVRDEDIASAIADSGFHMHVSLEEKKIVYYENDLISDLTNVLSGRVEGAETDMLFSLLGELLGNDYVTIGTKDKVSAKIDLEPFNRNTTGLIDDSKAQTFDLDACREKAKILIQSEVIDQPHLQPVFEYLVHGYDACNDDTKTYIAEKDFSACGISDTTTYDGVVHKNSRPLADIIGEKTVSIADLAMNKPITFMTEEEANDYIAGSGMIGFSFLLHDDSFDNISYITVDNFYGNLYRKDDVGHYSVIAGVSFNGYETSIIYDMIEKEDESTGYTISFGISDIYFGEYHTNGALSDYLFKLMAASLSSDPTIKITDETKTISIDFSSSLDQATKDAVALMGSPKMKVEGEDLSSEGRVVAIIE